MSFKKFLELLFWLVLLRQILFSPLDFLLGMVVGSAISAVVLVLTGITYCIAYCAVIAYAYIADCVENKQKEVTSCLSLAIENNDVEEFALQINSFFNSFWLRDIDSLLLKAVKKGCLEIVNLLLNKGANVNAKNIWGETVLIEAARYRHFSIIHALFNAGATVDIEAVCELLDRNEYLTDEFKSDIAHLFHVKAAKDNPNNPLQQKVGKNLDVMIADYLPFKQAQEILRFNATQQERKENTPRTGQVNTSDHSKGISHSKKKSRIKPALVFS